MKSFKPEDINWSRATGVPVQKPPVDPLLEEILKAFDEGNYTTFVTPTKKVVVFSFVKHLALVAGLLRPTLKAMFSSGWDEIRFDGVTNTVFIEKMVEAGHPKAAAYLSPMHFNNSTPRIQHHVIDVSSVLAEIKNEQVAQSADLKALAKAALGSTEAEDDMNAARRLGMSQASTDKIECGATKASGGQGINPMYLQDQ